MDTTDTVVTVDHVALLTIALPRSLLSRMHRHLSGDCWSLIAKRAFEAALEVARPQLEAAKERRKSQLAALAREQRERLITLTAEEKSLIKQRRQKLAEEFRNRERLIEEEFLSAFPKEDLGR